MLENLHSFIDSKYDGIETARLIMSKYFIPIVFVTSIDNPDVFRRANLSGFFDVIIKPYDNKMLLMHIEIALQNNRAKKAIIAISMTPLTLIFPLRMPEYSLRIPKAVLSK